MGANALQASSNFRINDTHISMLNFSTDALPKARGEVHVLWVNGKPTRVRRTQQCVKQKPLVRCTTVYTDGSGRAVVPDVGQ
jgi:hypothetical protein